jgi:hypothetical protein
MPRVSAADKLERRLIEALEVKAFDPATPAYAQIKAMGTLATLMRRRDKRMAGKAGAAAARAAARADAAPKNYNVLPWNHRGPDPSAPPAPRVIAPVAPGLDENGVPLTVNS